MSLPWVRLDSSWYTNPKVLSLLNEGPKGYRAVVVWLAALGHSGEHGLDGFLPAYALSTVHGRKADAALLVEHQLWVVAVGGGGWQVPDWGEYQLTNEETKKRSERARQAAAVRWSRQQANDGQRNG